MTQKQLKRIKPGEYFVRYIILSNEETGEVYKVIYWLGRRANGDFFIGFSPKGFKMTRVVDESEMLDLINDEEYSTEEAFKIYLRLSKSKK